MKTVYYNGDWLPIDEVKLSVMDRGFLFGDSVYEVIPTRKGRALFVPRHMARLADSLHLTGIASTLSGTDWRQIIDRILAAQDDEACCVYIQISRGVAAIRAHWVEPERPTVLVMCLPVPPRRGDAGVCAITRPDTRWLRCDIKSTSLLANVLLRRAAYQEGADETILLRDDQVTEGSASNVFAVHGRRVTTAPVDSHLLSGVTRAVVIELLRADGQVCEETGISRNALKLADEIWLTSSTGGINPVLRLDGHPVGDGRPGALWRRIVEQFDECERREQESGAAGNGDSV